LDFRTSISNSTPAKVFSVSSTNGISTADPGSGVGSWKLGKVITGATITLTATNYVEVMIDGVVVKLAVVQ
jgi:hypothetical protein